MEQGGISADEVTEAFKTVTSSGGRFFGMLDANAKTLDGSFSTLQDATDTFLGKTMEAFVGPLKTAVQGFTVVLNVIPGQLSGITLAVVGVTAAVAILAAGFTALTPIIAAAWAAFGPIAIIVAGLTALVAGVVTVGNELDKQNKTHLAVMETKYRGILASSVSHTRSMNDLVISANKVTGQFFSMVTLGTDFNTALTKTAEQLGLTKFQVATILLDSKGLLDTERLSLSTWIEHNKQVNLGVAKMGDFRDVLEKSSSEAAGLALAEKKRADTAEGIKQDYSNQLGFIADIIQSSKDLSALDDIALAEKADGIKNVYAKQLDYIAGVVSATKEQVSEREASEAKESTARQIVLGYQNQAINNQIKANDLEKDYLAWVTLSKEQTKEIVKGIELISAGATVMGAAFKKAGNEDMADLMNNLVKAGGNIAKLFASGGSDIGAWVGLAVQAIDVVGDTVLGWFGIETGAQKKAREERAKAEAEYQAKRAQAADAENKKFEDYGKSQAEILKSSYEKEIAYATAIGASIETRGKITQKYNDDQEKYFQEQKKRENEIANIQAENIAKRAKDLSDFMNQYSKDTRSRMVLIQEEESVALESAKALGASYEDRLKIQNAFAEKLSAEFNAQQKAVQDAQVAYQLKVTNEIKDQKAIADKAKQDIADSYTKAGSNISSLMISGMDNGKNIEKFRESFLSMMKKMAIEATVMSEQFKGKFADIGKLITSALSDGIFTEKELGQIDIKTSALFLETSKSTSLINDLFNRASLSDTLVATNSQNLAQTSINVYTTNDPLTIANAVSNVQQSLAYQGVVA